jgi:hypothetical protein
MLDLHALKQLNERASEREARQKAEHNHILAVIASTPRSAFLPWQAKNKPVSLLWYRLQVRKDV